MEDVLRLTLAGYLLLLSVAAVWGQHHNLLVYPARVFYSLLRILVFAFTLGRVRVTPRVRRTVLRGRRMRRSLRRSISDIREEQVASESLQWISERDKTESEG